MWIVSRYGFYCVFEVDYAYLFQYSLTAELFFLLFLTHKFVVV